MRHEERAFSPEDISALCHALHRATQALTCANGYLDEGVRQALAQAIMRHARAGERAVDQLVRLALAECRIRPTAG